MYERTPIYIERVKYEKVVFISYIGKKVKLSL
jgi:hypothetical protein